jgi:ubiquinone/menaquinone biosynthesis C-methylase UbiE
MTRPFELLKNAFENEDKAVASRFGYYEEIVNKDFFPHVVKKTEYILDTFANKGGRVLDYGCGSGLWTIFMAASGKAEKVYGIDYSYERIENLNWLRKRLDLENAVEVKKGDVHKLDFPDNFFDACLASEVLSHVKDLEAALGEISRTLKKGGVVFISDGNNSLSIPGMIARKKIHKRLEYGPFDDEIFKTTVLTDTLFNTRKKIIEADFGGLEEKTLRFLARKTRGMYGHQIRLACEEYIGSGRISQKADFLCRNPVAGEKMEYPLNPYRLKSILKKDYGIDSRVLPTFSSSPVSWKNIIRKLFVSTHPLSMLVSPFFEMAGTKVR